MDYTIALVYTGMPVKLVRMVEEELTRRFAGDRLTFKTLSDPSIIADAVKNGAPSKEAVGRLISMYAQALASGADAVLNICSSVGDIAGAAQPLFAAAGVPLVRIDEKMAEEAVKNYGSSDFVNVDGGANAIEITVQKKIDASWVPHTSGVDYSSCIDFGDLSVQFIESRRVDVDVPQQPRTKGPMYDIDIDAGEYTLHYRYAAFGKEERLTAYDLFKMITSCDYYKNF